ncbi:hypothetical protein B9Z19DRAFT_1134328 [Tuber borchii]|uniref:Uncharacterized protein n=1 Tax=Tuber borchii TaxID=42251 RepID=A0A2T6ZED6_TUBBO|nr:hypothetical protein B9Z19DRAFT_1134328 [Tuber borchii]
MTSEGDNKYICPRCGRSKWRSPLADWVVTKDYYATLDPVCCDYATDSDDEYTISGSEGDEPFTKDSSRSKGKGKGATSMSSSSQDIYTHKRGSGKTLRDVSGGGGYYLGPSTYRVSFSDSDGDGYPSSSRHSSSSRSKHPSSSGKSLSGLSHRDSSYDSEGSRTTHRTRHSGHDLPVGGHHNKDSGYQTHRRSSSRHRSSKSTGSSSKVHSGAHLSSSDGVSEGYQGRSRLPGSSEHERPSYSSRHRSRTGRPESRGPRDRDEDSQPPPYSAQPSSGGTSGGRRRRSERRKLGRVEEDEEGY